MTLTPRVACTTVVLGANGRYYDLGRGEFPGVVWAMSNGRLKKRDAQTIPRDAFTVTQAEADRLTGRAP